MPSHTQIKIRYGLILEQCVARALTEAGINYEQTAQYAELSEVPDFLIPDAANPQMMIECHQNGSRDSMRMKTLRVLIAVAEAKTYFGSELITGSVVFGDLGREFASSPVKALCSAFDANLLLQADSSAAPLIRQMEALSLDYAKNVSLSTGQAANKVCKTLPEAIALLSTQLKEFTKAARINPLLKDLWDRERERVEKSNLSTITGATFWKRALLQSLFLCDADFDELLEKDTSQLSEPLVRQGIRTGILHVEEEIDGDYIELDPAIQNLCSRSDSRELRQAVKEQLDASEEMYFFFEDIRDRKRRRKMAEQFLKAYEEGSDALVNSLIECATTSVFEGVEHRRCWIADMISLASGLSFNRYNKLIFTDENYPLTLWNPFSQIVVRTASFVNNRVALNASANVIGTEFFSHDHSRNAWSNDVEILADMLLQFRIDNAIKLRKVSPLAAVAEKICKKLGLIFERENLENFLFDVASEAGVGRFLVYVISHPVSGDRILFNAVAGYENPTDKAKEWAARCLALRYRKQGDQAVPADWSTSVFFADGEWQEKDQIRLMRGGWEHIVQLDGLEDTLRAAFKIQKSKATKSTVLPTVPDTEADLPMAAEDE